MSFRRPIGRAGIKISLDISMNIHILVTYSWSPDIERKFFLPKFFVDEESLLSFCQSYRQSSVMIHETL